MPKRNGELTTKEQSWLDEYVNNGDATEAAIKAGYKHPVDLGRKNVRTLQTQIQAAVLKAIGNAAPRALHTVIKLAKTAEKESVQLAAAKDLLDRAGFSVAQQVADSASDNLAAFGELVDKVNALVGKETAAVLIGGHSTANQEAIEVEAEVQAYEEPQAKDVPAPTSHSPRENRAPTPYLADDT
jgi:hypothetical protein